MTLMDGSFTLAAAQIEPRYYDKEGTVDKACRWIEKAGDAGADLVVFPEAYVPGYPYWLGSFERWTDHVIELQKNSLHVEDDEIDVLGEAVAAADVNVVLGAQERSDRPGSETVYNALFFFDRTGRLIGRHRKLMPTRTERMLWGRGDPASLRTYDTDVGTIGGLICYENHMTLSKAALCLMGEEIHAANWPGFWEHDPLTVQKSRAEGSEANDTCDIYPAMREYAFETQTFVVSCSGYMSDDVPEEFEGEMEGNFGVGGSLLVNPAGVVRAGPVFDEESLLTAEFERNERRAVKALIDAVGHYSRWDAVNLEISHDQLEPIHSHHGDVSGGAEKGPLPAVDVERLAEEHDVPVDTVDAIVAATRSEAP